VSASWGYSIAPYAMIIGFLFLISFWLLRTRVKQGKWTWDTPTLGKVELDAGISPEVEDRPEEKRFLRMVWNKFVEGI
jgi:hypothetical protein